MSNQSEPKGSRRDLSWIDMPVEPEWGEMPVEPEWGDMPVEPEWGDITPIDPNQYIEDYGAPEPERKMQERQEYADLAMRYIYMGRDRFHSVTRNDLYEFADKEGSSTLMFRSPTGSGKSYMACNSSIGNEKRILLVPTVTLSDQIGHMYGALVVNGDVEELDIGGHSLIVGTYDGLARIYPLLDDPSEWALYIDEFHQFSLASGYRGGTIDYVRSVASSFRVTILMTATPMQESPIEYSASVIVVSDIAFTPPVYTSFDVDYVQMALQEKQNGNLVVLSVNDRARCQALASVMRESGLTVCVATSETKDSKEFKDMLSGEFLPDVIICTSVINDGMNLPPRKNVVIISHYSRFVPQEIRQLCARFRDGGAMAIPEKVVLCYVNEPVFELSKEGAWKSALEIYTDVTVYAEMLKTLHAHVNATGLGDEEINQAVQYACNRLVFFGGQDRKGVQTVAPSLSACIGEALRQKKNCMTAGDLLSELNELYKMPYAGHMDYGPKKFDIKVTDAVKEVKAHRKEEAKAAIVDVISALYENKASKVSKVLEEYLSPDSAKKYTKAQINVVKYTAQAMRRFEGIDGFSYAKFADVVNENVSSISSARGLAKASNYHAILYYASQGQGAERPDAQMIRAIWELHEVGDTFTRKSIEKDLNLLGYASHAPFLVPKNPITFMKHLFSLSSHRRRVGDSLERVYKITRKQLMTKHVIEKGSA